MKRILLGVAAMLVLTGTQAWTQATNNVKVDGAVGQKPGTGDSVLVGGDWPTWRHDPARTAAMAERLPAKLHLKWVRMLPKAIPAWPLEPRMLFDPGYEPVAAGKTLFIGSSVDGSVTAYDTETGTVRWKFYTEGPVRFAPLVAKGCVFVASDDGRLYALDAAAGTPRWVFRAVAADLPDLHHLGNGRLISFWPVRGGPVLVGDTICFASGIWPAMGGVFIFALDAATGKPVWQSDSLSFLPNTRIDHNFIAHVAVAPQGYLAATGDTLIIPSGRSLPALLDARTGKLRSYLQGYRNGDCRVTVQDKLAFVGSNGVINLTTGLEIGSRWVKADKETAPADLLERTDSFQSPPFQYKFVPGCDAWSVLDGEKVYGFDQNTFFAYSTQRAALSNYAEKFTYGGFQSPARWDPAELWKVATKYSSENVATKAIIAAGGRLYTHAGRTLIALDLVAADGKPAVTWEEKLDGTPIAIIAADSKLFVATEEGGIYCYAAGQDEVRKFPIESKPPAKVEDDWTRRASRILKETGVTEGYCLVLGLESGRLVEELLAQSALQIIAVDSDPAKVRRLRETLVAAGCYGRRAEVFTGDPLGYLFPPYIASLIVSETLTAADVAAHADARKFFDVLRPYGGTACLKSADARAFTAWITGANLENAKAPGAEDFALLQRAGALPGAAAWTHETVDAARSYCSADQRLKPPLGILWYGEDDEHGFAEANNYDDGEKARVVGGRLFCLNKPQKYLKAIDVYTGRLLWTVTTQKYTRFVAMEDGIYVANGDMCDVLDPASGKPLKQFKFNAGFAEGESLLADVKVSGDVILIAVGQNREKSERAVLLESTVLVALDRSTGAQLWRRNAKEGFSNSGIAFGDGLLFVTDALSNALRDELTRRGEGPGNEPLQTTILALHPRTGEVKWTFVADYRFHRFRCYAVNDAIHQRAFGNWVAYSGKSRMLLVGRIPVGGVFREEGGQDARSVYALDPQSGKCLWSKRIKTYPPMILRDDTFVTQSGEVYSILSGERKDPVEYFYTSIEGFRGCNYAVGSQYLYFMRNVSASYVDAQTARRYHLRSVRSGCSSSYVAADGVLAVPNLGNTCKCNYPVKTSFALVPMPWVEPWSCPLLASKSAVESEQRAGPGSPAVPASALCKQSELCNLLETCVTRVTPAPQTEPMSADTAGEGGTNRTGVAWLNPRFSKVAESGAETNQIRDNLTGLIWARNANLASGTVWSVNGTCTWVTAFNVITNSAGPVNGANYGGCSDWRLPSDFELYSLVYAGNASPALAAGHPFVGVQSNVYWSKSMDMCGANSNIAEYVVMPNDFLYRDDKMNTFYVWPVRGGQ